jgi:surface carbohydrate biosynthesis protein (TIGR04326 family)
MTTAFLFSSSGATCPQQPNVTISFNGSAASCAAEIAVSLPNYIESHDEQLRSQFLAFVHQVGATDVDGKSVIQHLQIDPTFSFWWMMLFALRRWHPDSGIIQAVKILALEQILVDLKISTLHIEVSEGSVQSCVVDVCKRLGISAVLRHPIKRRSQLPHVLTALATFGRTLLKSGYSSARVQPLTESPSITVVDYFNGFDIAAADSGEYRSRFWSDLPTIIGDQFNSSQWLHIRDIGKQSLSKNQSEHLATSLSTLKRSHTAIDLLDMRNIRWQVTVDYLRLVLISFKLRSVHNAFTPKGSQANLWPLFSAEWAKSLRGSIAIQHLTQFHAMRNRISKLPKQACGIYLMENQPWEMALISAWKASGHGTLIGVPHAAPKFWEVRRFVDPQSRVANGVECFPQPDVIATNSSLMHQELTDNGFPKNRLVPVEALAFAHLTSLCAKSTSSTASKQVAVLGDFSETITNQLLDMIRGLKGALPQGSVFKPHPACMIEDEKLAQVGLRAFTGEISDLLATADITITTSSTSAALEAYCLGRTVIMLVDGAHFNMSPLRRNGDVFFVHSLSDLTAALTAALSSDSGPQREFFNLGDQFPLWTAFLTDLSHG